jgi:hypothetical protein
MAIVGEFRSLSNDELKSAFDEARINGYDYLVVHAKTHSDDFCVNFYESATPVRASQQREDLLKAQVGNGYFVIKKVLDLSQDFKNAFASKTDADNNPLSKQAIAEAAQDFRLKSDYHSYLERKADKSWIERIFKPEFAPPEPKWLPI